MLFDKIIKVEEQYKEMGASDQEIENKIQYTRGQAEDIRDHMESTLGKYSTRGFQHYNNITILIEVRVVKDEILKNYRSLEIVVEDL